MSYWPDSIKIEDVRSPVEILNEAGTELEQRTGKLRVTVVETQLSDRTVLAFHVANQGTGRTLNLFEVTHEVDFTYPVVINPPASDIPEFLQRERYVPGKPGFVATASAAFGTSGTTIKNNWVCATPSEFTEKLTSLFQRDIITRSIFSLMTTNAATHSSQKGNIFGDLEGTNDEE